MGSLMAATALVVAAAVAAWPWLAPGARPGSMTGFVRAAHTGGRAHAGRGRDEGAGAHAASYDRVRKRVFAWVWALLQSTANKALWRHKQALLRGPDVHGRVRGPVPAAPSVPSRATR